MTLLVTLPVSPYMILLATVHSTLLGTLHSRLLVTLDTALLVTLQIALTFSQHMTLRVTLLVTLQVTLQLVIAQVRDCGSLLTVGGFNIPAVDVDDITIHYKDFNGVLKHIR